jgi:hypothetical protein
MYHDPPVNYITLHDQGSELLIKVYDTGSRTGYLLILELNRLLSYFGREIINIIFFFLNTRVVNLQHHSGNTESTHYTRRLTLHKKLMLLYNEYTLILRNIYGRI